MSYTRSGMALSEAINKRDGMMPVAKNARGLSVTSIQFLVLLSFIFTCD